MQGAEWNSELETRPHGNHFAFAKGIASRDRAKKAASAASQVQVGWEVGILQSVNARKNLQYSI